MKLHLSGCPTDSASSHLISSHPKFTVQEEGQFRGAESLKGGSVPARKADRLHDQRLFSRNWRS